MEITARLGLIAPNPNDGAALYRSRGPLTEIREVITKTWLKGESISWGEIRDQDLVMMARPYTATHKRIAAMIKRCGRPLWIDHDDYILGIPEGAPNYNDYMREDVRDNILDVMAMADVVTVSTDALKVLFDETLTLERGIKDSKIHVIRNSYDPYFHGPLQAASSRELIVWRGTTTHNKDLEEYAAVISEFMTNNPSWKIEFMGYCPDIFKSTISANQLVITDGFDPYIYMQYLKTRRPGIVIVPLQNNPFNQCKSNIAWIEATVAGALTLTPKWFEWQTGGSNYTGIHDFESKLEALKHQLSSAPDKIKTQQELLIKNYTLNKANEKRLEIINSLVSRASLMTSKVSESRFKNIFGLDGFAN